MHRDASDLLPRNVPDGAPPRGSAADVGAGTGERPATVRVHVVDDDEAVRFSIALLIEACGWEPRAYTSAEDFLANYAPCDGADCLVLDLQMPGMTGADLQETLVARGVALPVIAISAFVDTDLARRVKAAGARAVLRKPFVDELLVSEIRKALDLRPY